MAIPDVIQMAAFASSQDAFGAYIDNDNATCWLFQYRAGGFARCSMTDGSVLFQGNIFNDPSALIDYHGQGTPFWAQDNAGNYYSAVDSVIYKLQIGASAPTDFGNGYLATESTLDLKPTLGPVSIIGWCLDTKGHLMLADSLNHRVIVIDTGIMAVVGSYVATSPNIVISAPFVDASGNFWATFSNADLSVSLMKWTPESGATSGHLNVTVIRSALKQFGITNQITFAHYAPMNHAVLLGNTVGSFTGQLALISLSILNCIAFLPTNPTEFYSGTSDAPNSCAQTPALSHGGIALPGDTGDNTQVGGIYNLIVPQTLKNSRTYNVTEDIIGDGFPVPAAVQGGRGPNPIPTPFANMRYNQTLDRVLVTYQASGSAAYSVKVGGGGGHGGSLGLAAVRSYCQAYGIFISGVMDTQRPASEWLKELSDIANCAPVWNGSQLNFIPRCEVSAAGNGAIFTAATANGPLAVLDDSIFRQKDGPPVTITRNRPADAYNVLPIEHVNRLDAYNHTVTTIRDQGDIFKHGSIKASVRQMLFIHDQATAFKVGWPLVRRSTIVERLSFSFTLPKNYSWLDPYDLVSLKDKILDLNGFPVRFTSITENSTFDLECIAEPFYYGAHAPTPTMPASVPITTSFNQNALPGDVNVPIILEPVGRLNQFSNQGAIWVIASGASPNYGGCVVFMSVDGGSTYTQQGIINGNATTGAVFQQDFPVGTDPDNVNTLFVDIGESFGQQLPSFTADQMNAFQSLIYIGGGGAITVNGQNLNIPYELSAYETPTLISGGQYHIDPPTRRGVYGTPITDHVIGAQFALVDTQFVVQIPLDPALIGKTLFFKLAAFNLFMQEQQDISGLTAYSFTPTGQVGGSQLLNQSQSGYSTTPAQLVFQGQTGGQPGQPTFTDPTKIYILSPFTANFPTGPVTYNSVASPQTIPGTAPEILYVSIEDPSHSGSGTLHVDTDPTNFNSSGFTRVGKIFINDITTGGSTSIPITPQGQPSRQNYDLMPAPDNNETTFTIVHGIPSGPYVDVYVNGALQNPETDYVLLSNQIVFSQAPKATDRIWAVF